MYLRRSFSIVLILSLFFSLASPDHSYAQFGQKVKTTFTKCNSKAKQVFKEFGPEVAYSIAGEVTTASIIIGLPAVTAVIFPPALPGAMIISGFVLANSHSVSVALSHGIKELVKKGISKSPDKITTEKNEAESKETEENSLLIEKIATATDTIIETKSFISKTSGDKSLYRKRMGKARLKERRFAWDRRDIGSSVQFKRLEEESFNNERKRQKMRLSIENGIAELRAVNYQGQYGDLYNLVRELLNSTGEAWDCIERGDWQGYNSMVQPLNDKMAQVWNLLDKYGFKDDVRKYYQGLYQENRDVLQRYERTYETSFAFPEASPRLEEIDIDR